MADYGIKIKYDDNNDNVDDDEDDDDENGVDGIDYDCDCRQSSCLRLS